MNPNEIRAKVTTDHMMHHRMPNFAYQSMSRSTYGAFDHTKAFEKLSYKPKEEFNALPTAPNNFETVSRQEYLYNGFENEEGN